MNNAYGTSASPSAKRKSGLPSFGKQLLNKVNYSFVDPALGGIKRTATGAASAVAEGLHLQSIGRGLSKNAHRPAFQDAVEGDAVLVDESVTDEKSGFRYFRHPTPVPFVKAAGEVWMYQGQTYLVMVGRSQVNPDKLGVYVMAPQLHQHAWAQLTLKSAPPVRFGHSVVVCADALVVYGGWGRDEVYGDTFIVNLVTAYETGKGRWSAPTFTTKQQPRPRAFHSCTLLDGESMMVYGGSTFNTWNEYSYYDDLWVLDLIHFRWERQETQGVSKPGQRAQHTAVPLARGGGGTDVVLFGGVNGNWIMNDFYYLTTQPFWLWQPIASTDCPYPRVMSTPVAYRPPLAFRPAAVWQNRLYLYGGPLTGDDGLPKLYGVDVVQNGSALELVWSILLIKYHPVRYHPVMLSDDEGHLYLIGGSDHTIEGHMDKARATYNFAYEVDLTIFPQADDLDATGWEYGEDGVVLAHGARNDYADDHDDEDDESVLGGARVQQTETQEIDYTPYAAPSSKPLMAERPRGPQRRNVPQRADPQKRGDGRRRGWQDEGREVEPEQSDEDHDRDPMKLSSCGPRAPAAADAASDDEESFTEDPGFTMSDPFGGDVDDPPPKPKAKQKSTPKRPPKRLNPPMMTRVDTVSDEEEQEEEEDAVPPPPARGGAGSSRRKTGGAGRKDASAAPARGQSGGHKATKKAVGRSEASMVFNAGDLQKDADHCPVYTSKMIGRGTFGKVYQGLHPATGEFVAVKQLKTQGLSPKDIKKIKVEINLLRNLDHENIVRYLGSYIENGRVSIVMEYVTGGSLLNLVSQCKGGLPEVVVQRYMGQVVAGVGYLHTLPTPVMHRDIKPANILVDASGICKVADFGASKHLAIATTKHETSVTGTPLYMAPEIISGKSVSELKSDVWSIGCTMLEVLDGRRPWYHKSKLEPLPLCMFVVNCGTPPLYPKHCSDKAKSFLDRCFERDLRKRASCIELAEHPFCDVEKRDMPTWGQRRSSKQTRDDSPDEDPGSGREGRQGGGDKGGDATNVEGGGKASEKLANENKALATQVEAMKTQMTKLQEQLRTAQSGSPTPVTPPPRTASPSVHNAGVDPSLASPAGMRWQAAVSPMLSCHPGDHVFDTYEDPEAFLSDHSSLTSEV